MIRGLARLLLTVVLALNLTARPGQPQDTPRTDSNRLDIHGDPLPLGAVARMGTSRFNPGNFLVGVAYTDDGKGLISFGDSHARIWDAHDGRLVRTIIPDGAGGAREFALTADGKRMLTVERSPDAHYRIWDFDTGRELCKVPVPDPKPYLWATAYSPDGRFVASLAYGRFIQLRDGQTLAELRRVEVGREVPSRIVFSPDGNELLGTIEQAGPGAHFARLPGGGQPQGPAGPLPRPADAPAETSSIRFWNVATGAVARDIRFDGCHLTGLAFSPSGRRLVAAGCDSTIRLLDPRTGRELSRMNVNGPPQGPLAFTPDESILASGDFNTNAPTNQPAGIHLFDLSKKAEVRRFAAHPFIVRELAFSPDGRTLASVGHERLIRRWETATGRPLDPGAGSSASLTCLVVTPDGLRIITGGMDSRLREWDAASGRELAVIGQHPSLAYDLAISPDGRSLLSGDVRASLYLWDLADRGRPARALEPNRGSRGRGLAFSPDGLIATAGGKLFEVATRDELGALLDEDGKPFRPWASAAFTPDSSGLVATNGSVIWLWKTSGGRPVRKIAAPGYQINTLALSPDGRFLAVGVNDAVRLWHIPTAREIATRMQNDDPNVTASFSPDGRLIVSGCGQDTGSADPSVRVREMASGQEVRRFLGHRAGVYSVAFFPDSRRIASASADATALVWDLSLEADGPVAPDVASAPPNLERDWTDLAADAATAYRAIWRMSAAPDRSAAFMETRLHPIQPDDPDRDTSIGPKARGETLRRLRAIAVLEKIDTPAARRTLERLATGLEGGARNPRRPRGAAEGTLVTRKELERVGSAWHPPHGGVNRPRSIQAQRRARPRRTPHPPPLLTTSSAPAARLFACISRSAAPKTPCTPPALLSPPTIRMYQVCKN